MWSRRFSIKGETRTETSPAVTVGPGPTFLDWASASSSSVRDGCVLVHDLYRKLQGTKDALKGKFVWRLRSRPRQHDQPRVTDHPPPASPPWCLRPCSFDKLPPTCPNRASFEVSHLILPSLPSMPRNRSWSRRGFSSRMDTSGSGFFETPNASTRRFSPKPLSQASPRSSKTLGEFDTSQSDQCLPSIPVKAKNYMMRQVPEASDDGRRLGQRAT